MESPVNLWVRANIEQTDTETRHLVSDYEQPEYEAILEEKMAANIALNSLLGLIPAAQERVVQAQQVQLDFFRKQQTKGVI